MLSAIRYSPQYHLVQAWLDAGIQLAAGEPASALGIVTMALDRYDLPTSSPRYAWPLLVRAAEAALAAGDGDPLAERLHVIAEKLEAHGPVQSAWQLMFRAADPLAEPEGLPGGTRLTAWDAAAAAWEELKDSHLTVTALAAGARQALAAAHSAAGRAEAASRLRRAAPIAERLGARLLAEQVTVLAQRASLPLGDGTPGTAPLGLTGREYEVLRLVAGAIEPGDRDGAVHLAEDRERARLQYSGQAGRGQPHRGGG